MSTRRRVTPALTPEQERGFLRWAYLERYDDDPEFGEALVALYDRWTADIGELPFSWWELSSRAVFGEAALAAGHAPPAGHDAIAGYVDEVEELARRCGLDRMTDDGASSRTLVSRDRTAADNSVVTLVWTIGYTSGKATVVTDALGQTTSPVTSHTFTYGSGTTTVGLLKDTTNPSSPVRNTWTYAYG